MLDRAVDHVWPFALGLSATPAEVRNGTGRYDDPVPVDIPGESGTNAVLVGGPLDGREHRIEPGTAELLVVMEDGARHLYGAGPQEQTLVDGRVVPVFEYRGRDYPLRSSDS
jgi:hypothetical protein